MIGQGLYAPGRGLFLLHYAGHGVERDGHLFFTSQDGRRFNVGLLLGLADGNGYMLSPDSEIDIVFIFDSCFSHVATRNMVNAERIVEVLAATSPNSPLANAAQGRASFTGKLWNEIMHRKAQGHKSVELAELMDTLITKSPQVRPSYKLLIGVHSLRLELPGGSGSTVVPPPVVEPQYFAVFSIPRAEAPDAANKQKENLPPLQLGAARKRRHTDF
ncbi:hypothetical protein BDV24DRAFT_154353 [Aspergillus arachidicola]|uniref:Uncharacterized protein n=1 Tax=Aspergillus arachidicola TaxID=656916 RepID=A0A5N6XWL6_9EURO|nr:hypothetical protein BDV24DRAFT_154353 [Aspergillus arachidicola]